jgi:hypothetical protein
VFGSERLTGALLDRLTHHVHILEMNGESFRLATSKKAQRRSGQSQNANAKSPDEGGAAHIGVPLRYAPWAANVRGRRKKPGLNGPFLSPRLVHFYAAFLHNLSPRLTIAAEHWNAWIRR